MTLEVLRAESALALIPHDTELSQKYAKVRPWEPLPQSSLGESSSAGWEEPAADADPYESPPSLDEPSAPAAEDPPSAVAALEERETLDARPAQKPVKAEKKIPAPTLAPLDDEEPPPPVAESDDGIRINTQDILVEEEEDNDASPATQLTSGESKVPAKKAPRTKKKKEGSIEIDIAGMWDDFEVDNYDEILAAASEELDSFGEVKELGAEKSVPPPVPGGSKKKK